MEKARYKQELEPSTGKITVDVADLTTYLDAPKKRVFNEISGQRVGQSHGLGYNPLGGSVLDIQTKVRALDTSYQGTKPALKITGNIVGTTMTESIHVALSYLTTKFTLTPTQLNKEIHIHFNDFVPKDGPSAGLAIATSLLSALTDNPIHQDIAMTGTIDFYGKAGVIGGLKEKLLGARQIGIKRVFVPYDNKVDVETMSESVKDHFEIVDVSDVSQLPAIPQPTTGKIKVIYVRRLEDILKHTLNNPIPTTI